MHCSGLKSVTIPVSVMRIVSYCFDDRTNLTNLIYPENHESGYLEDNVIYKTDGITPGKIADPSIPIDVLEEKPIWLDGLSALPSKDVPSSIMTYGGARPADRDAVDKRLIEEFKNSTGGIPNSQNDVGGYPAAEATYRKLDVPETGIVQWLEGYTRSVMGLGTFFVSAITLPLRFRKAGTIVYRLFS